MAQRKDYSAEKTSRAKKKSNTIEKSAKKQKTLNSWLNKSSADESGSDDLSGSDMVNPSIEGNDWKRDSCDVVFNYRISDDNNDKPNLSDDGHNEKDYLGKFDTIEQWFNYSFSL